MYARATRFVKKGLKNRYYNKGKKSVRFNRIAKDVYNLKQAINSEKKHHLVVPSSNTFAQYESSSTTSGAELIELTPSVPQGTGANQRIGNQIKITGACMELLLTKQPNQHGTIAYKIMLVQQANGNDTMTMADLLEGNHFISGATIYDTTSQRNQMQMANFKVIKTLTGRFQQDQNDEATGGGSDANIKRNFTIPLKFTSDNLIKYNHGSSTDAIRNRFYLVCLASNGQVTTGTGIQIQQYTKRS